MPNAADLLAPPSPRLKNPRPFPSGHLTRSDRDRIFNRAFLYRVMELASYSTPASQPVPERDLNGA